MVEVDAEHVIDVAFDDAKGFHVIGERRIAETGTFFRRGDGAVDEDRRIFRKELYKSEDLAERLAWLAPGEDGGGCGDRARVDKRIARHPALPLQLHDRIKRISGRLATEPAP